MQARYASAGERGVHDVVVDERGGVEVLDRRRRGPRTLGIAAHRFGSQHADERPVPLAGVGGVVRQHLVEVALHVGVRAVAEELRQVGVELLRVTLEIELESGHDPPGAPWDGPRSSIV